MSEAKLNPARKRMLQKLFLRRDRLVANLARIEHSINTIGREYWKEQGYRIMPRCGPGLRQEVFKEG